MSKFKVGDTVRVVDYSGGLACKVNGSIGVVAEVDAKAPDEDLPYTVRFDPGIQISADTVWKEEIFSAAQLELVTYAKSPVQAAIETLREIMQDPTVSADLRLKAAQTLLASGWGHV